MSTFKPKTISEILIATAFILAVVFGAGAGLAFWGHHFAENQVKSQLVQEKVFFPPAGSESLKPDEFPTLQKYAGQQVDNGAKAKAYADEFIWVHMMKVAGCKTYSEVSILAQKDPKDAKLAGQKAVLFQGDMLRSSLLTAFAFSRFDVIAEYASIACLVASVILLVLAGTGLARFEKSPVSVAHHAHKIAKPSHGKKGRK